MSQHKHHKRPKQELHWKVQVGPRQPERKGFSKLSAESEHLEFCDSLGLQYSQSLQAGLHSGASLYSCVYIYAYVYVYIDI